MLGVTQLGHQPDKNAARTELSHLVNGYPDDPTLSGVVRAGLLNTLPPGQVNDEQRTRAIAKAVCAACRRRRPDVGPVIRASNPR